MFITFEGGEGSGKTTLINNLELFFKNEGIDFITTREPGGFNNDIAEQIRNVILDKKNTLMTARTEALLYAASRTQHLEQTIIPSLQAGKLVFCDRYIDSSFVYQGYARALGIEYIQQINNFALDYMPDLTFYIDVSTDVGQARIKNRHEKNRLDVETKKFHDNVRTGYLNLKKVFPNRIKIIDGQRNSQIIFNEILEIILTHLK